MLDPYELLIHKNPKVIVSSAGTITDTLQQLIQDYENYLNATKDNPMYVTMNWSDDLVDKLCSVPNVSFMITPDELKIIIAKNEEDGAND